ncbi:META domain-containing protein [Halobacteriovorax sp. JY17]|uniref:META domain-containing protein n=1 Tax=Halobacteriovorax sp. JY17 TaxID=2014617 RepID=UPI000C5AB67E|nr:META domain-containing protein [Halobacteriovorax sp. JY17]PIK14780.1 MAG: hypothetical protein CES88_10610 [Halobacteriovorax sp. JY17]
MKTILFITSIFLFSCATIKEAKNQNILGKWKVTNIQNVEIPKEVDSHFNFQMEDKLGGNSSCNNYFATYKVKGSEVMISQSGSTKKLCFGKLNNYEFLFFQSLPLVHRFETERNHLTLFSKEGKVLFKATRD